MCSEVINGLFSIGTALIAFVGGILTARIGYKRKEKDEKINQLSEQVKELKEDVSQLANEVISYAEMENAIVGELKTWTDEYKKAIRADFYEKLFGDRNKSLMTKDKAQRIIDKYSL